MLAWLWLRSFDFLSFVLTYTLFEFDVIEICALHILVLCSDPQQGVLHYSLGPCL